MMRLLLCIGDEPETGGHIESSGTRYTIRGHEVALIGAMVHCNACKNSGPIAKAGGPRRPWHQGVEVAHEGDVVLCKCSSPPKMIASMQSTSRNDDMVESRGHVFDDYRVAMPSVVSAALFDQGFVLKDRHSGRPLAGMSYRMRSSSGAIDHGITDSRGRTIRVETVHAETITIEVKY